MKSQCLLSFTQDMKMVTAHTTNASSLLTSQVLEC